MHPAIIMLLSSLATGAILILALFIERWTWKQNVDFQLGIPNWRRTNRGKILSVIISMAIIGAIGALFFSVANPYKEPFTEFYLLSLSGEATDYPSLLIAGEEGKVRVGIVNGEYETITYRVAVRTDGVISNDVELVTLEYGEKWEEIVDFIIDRVGNKQKVEFLLYKQGRSEIYRNLHLLVDVQ